MGVDNAAVEANYDLVVVGGGIRGLAAVWFYRRAVGPNARIQSIQSPKTLSSDVAKGLLVELGIDLARFETAFERDIDPSLGLSRGVFFDRETFRRDAIVPGEALLSRSHDTSTA